MGGLSPVHLGLLLVIALLVFGPKKLPEIGRELGQAIREFKKASREVMESFHAGADERPYPTYDSYASREAASEPANPAAPAVEASPPAAVEPSMPAGPPPGTVGRSASALAEMPAAEAAPAVGAAHAEPAGEPAPAPERNT